MLCKVLTCLEALAQACAIIKLLAQNNMPGQCQMVMVPFFFFFLSLSYGSGMTAKSAGTLASSKAIVNCYTFSLQAAFTIIHNHFFAFTVDILIFHPSAPSCTCSGSFSDPLLQATLDLLTEDDLCLSDFSECTSETVHYFVVYSFHYHAF